MRALYSMFLLALLSACASYDGRGLQAGLSTRQDVERLMGPPALRWAVQTGGEQLAYPRGPMGYHTYMVMIDASDRLLSIRNVLEPSTFARIGEGMSQDEILQWLGPPTPEWTSYFERRDELVWEWRYCDDWGEAARFNVLFDGTRGTVRSTGSLTEKQRFGAHRRNSCSR